MRKIKHVPVVAILMLLDCTNDSRAKETDNSGSCAQLGELLTNGRRLQAADQKVFKGRVGDPGSWALIDPPKSAMGFLR